MTIKKIDKVDIKKAHILKDDDELVLTGKQIKELNNYNKEIGRQEALKDIDKKLDIFGYEFWGEDLPDSFKELKQELNKLKQEQKDLIIKTNNIQTPATDKSVVVGSRLDGLKAGIKQQEQKK